MNKFKAYFLATRPPTLVASLCPILVGCCYAWTLDKNISLISVLLILITALLIQIATNFFNDAIDFEKGADAETRLGPDRAALKGWLEPKALKLWAFGMLALAFVLGLYLTTLGGPYIFIIGASALVLAYLYTATSWSLAYTGLADIFVILYFGVLAVSGTQVILNGTISLPALVLGLQVGLVCNTLLLINNLRDIKDDEKKDKKTIVVRFGRPLGLAAFIFCGATPFLIGLFWAFGGLPRVFFFPFLSLPVLVLVFLKIYQDAPSKKYNLYLKIDVLFYLFFSILLSLGVVLS